MKKIISVIGARPQIIKSAAISRCIKRQFSDEILERVVHTGQHYDANLSELFFDELEMAMPDYNLQVGSGSHGEQTAKMIHGLEQIFLNEKPDLVLVYGDTNSTLAGGLAAAKLHIPVAHIEAGLRSFNKAMPEEINRITTDHLSTLLFTPTESGLGNLKKEGFSLTPIAKPTIDRPNVFHCGDIMYDNSLHFAQLSDTRSHILSHLKLTENQFVLSTIHRDSNTDNPTALMSILKALRRIQNDYQLPIILPLHPRTKAKLYDLASVTIVGELLKNQNIKIIEPLGFLDIIALERNARIIVTDSGGLQKEAYFFKKPCVILRPQTEWIEIVENGNAICCGSDENAIVDGFSQLYFKEHFTFPNFYGNGDAASFICQQILSI
jgi:UDP-GlcNAc3NAcA epimerase